MQTSIQKELKEQKQRATLSGHGLAKAIAELILQNSKRADCPLMASNSNSCESSRERANHQLSGSRKLNRKAPRG